MKAAELFVKCLENEGVGTMYGLPGEENMDVMDALLDSSIEFISTRHEQGAAFMADVHGRLTQRAGVCLATLGPGATNLVTGVADANMDRAPLVAITGQAGLDRLHKESHQAYDLVELFTPITKCSTQVIRSQTIPEVVRKAFKVAQTPKLGACHIDFPEDVAKESLEGEEPLRMQQAALPEPLESKLKQAAEVINGAKYPVVLVGNAVIRGRASEAFRRFAERTQIPVANTFMAKGVLPDTHPLSLHTVGLQARDWVSCGFDRADVVIAVGYDLVEYPPSRWNPKRDKRIIHIDQAPAEVDAHFVLEAGIIGDISIALDQLAELLTPRDGARVKSLHDAITQELQESAEDEAFPVKPQRLLCDLRKALAPEDIILSDVGAHKIWIARMYETLEPNTCLISNGFASMGIALPGAIAAKRLHPDRAVVAVMGDGGFLMNCQEMETAVRVGTPIICLIFHDGGYGLIEWKQRNLYGRPSHVTFGNPDFVKFAESFGCRGVRIGATGELLPALEEAKSSDVPVIIDCPVDYGENLKLTEKMGQIVCPI
jgi:acetolactate synthase I/II/III large subunit